MKPCQCSFTLPSLIWKGGCEKIGCLIYQNSSISWMTGVCHTLWREGCSAHTVNAMGPCLEEKILPKEMPTCSEAGSENLGTGLGSRPVLETGRQQRWGGRWGWGWLTGSNEAPRRDHGSAASAGAGGGLCCGSPPQLFPAQTRECWFHPAISIKEGTPSQ